MLHLTIPYFTLATALGLLLQLEETELDLLLHCLRALLALRTYNEIDR